jgi:hypothetical protein
MEPCGIKGASEAEEKALQRLVLEDERPLLFSAYQKIQLVHNAADAVERGGDVCTSSGPPSLLLDWMPLPAPTIPGEEDEPPAASSRASAQPHAKRMREEQAEEQPVYPPKRWRAPGGQPWHVDQKWWNTLSFVSAGRDAPPTDAMDPVPSYRLADALRMIGIEREHHGVAERFLSIGAHTAPDQDLLPMLLGLAPMLVKHFDPPPADNSTWPGVRRCRTMAGVVPHRGPTLPPGTCRIVWLVQSFVQGHSAYVDHQVHCSHVCLYMWCFRAAVQHLFWEAYTMGVGEAHMHWQQDFKELADVLKAVQTEALQCIRNEMEMPAASQLKHAKALFKVWSGAKLEALGGAVPVWVPQEVRV